MPRGRRVAVLTNAGGPGILCADACEAAGPELPQLSEDTVRAIAPLLPGRQLANPVDMLGSASDSSYESVLPFLLADPAVDAVIVLFVPAVRARRRTRSRMRSHAWDQERTVRNPCSPSS
jgi:acyl-CoA synthetase (NDP forming)